MTSPAAPPSVLVVDDDPHVLAVVVRMLRKRGLDVHAAQTAHAALQALADHPIRMIVTDFRMPGVNGLDFLTAAKRVRPGARSMMMTGHADVPLAQRAVNEHHVRRLFQKPVDLDVLADAVDAELRADQGAAEAARRLAEAFARAKP